MKIAVIGAGAAGMAAALAAAREGADVTLYEGNDRVGKKILVTGNGKCNLGNRNLSVRDYHSGNPGLVASCLERFGTEETIAFFRDLGLMVREKGGYLYPFCEQASAVLDVLRFALEERGIQVITQCKVTGVRRMPVRNQGKGPGCLEVAWKDGRAAYDRVILTCGGRAAPKTGSDGSGYALAGNLGIEVTPVYPALTGLRCGETWCRSLAGVRAEGAIRILGEDGKVLLQERGELQFTDYGVSGIPVFQLSGQVNALLSRGGKYRARIDFFPDMGKEDYGRLTEERYREALERKNGGEAVTVERFFTGMLHRKLMTLFLRLAGLAGGEAVAEADRKAIFRVFALCRELPMTVTGSNSFENAQVCAGGVRLSEVTDSLESRKVPGLFFAGEILDVDGRCGGYNLQWAWTSGHIAGWAAGRKTGNDSNQSVKGAGRVAGPEGGTSCRRRSSHT